MEIIFQARIRQDSRRIPHSGEFVRIGPVERVRASIVRRSAQNWRMLRLDKQSVRRAAEIRLRAPPQRIVYLQRDAQQRARRAPSS